MQVHITAFCEYSQPAHWDQDIEGVEVWNETIVLLIMTKEQYRQWNRECSDARVIAGTRGVDGDQPHDRGVLVPCTWVDPLPVEVNAKLDEWCQSNP